MRAPRAHSPVPSTTDPIAQSVLLQLISLPLTPPRHATPRHATPRHATPRHARTHQQAAAERQSALERCQAAQKVVAQQKTLCAEQVRCCAFTALRTPWCSRPHLASHHPAVTLVLPSAPHRTSRHQTGRLLAVPLCVSCAEQNSVAKLGASERTAAEFALREARRMAVMTRQARRKRLAERRSHREDAVRCPPHPSLQPNYRQPICSAADILSAAQARFVCTFRPAAHAAYVSRCSPVASLVPSLVPCAPTRATEPTAIAGLDGRAVHPEEARDPKPDAAGPRGAEAAVAARGAYARPRGEGLRLRGRAARGARHRGGGARDARPRQGRGRAHVPVRAAACMHARAKVCALLPTPHPCETMRARS